MRSFFEQHQHSIILWVVFLLSFALFFYLQASPTFADPDSFYHAKMATFLRDGTLVRDFRWLPFTTLSHDYIDQHFLYHVLLVPFVTFTDPLIGIKVATVLFAATLVTLFTWTLLTARVRFPLLFLAVLLVTNPFLFRVSLAKAPAVSLIAALIGFAYLLRRRWPALFALSVAYVWLYGGFILIVILAGIVWLVEAFHLYFQSSVRTSRGFLNVLRRSPATHSLLAVLAGIVVGLVLNPYFPRNLAYLWQQLVQIGIVNYQAVIGVGAEWYPYAALDIVSNNVFTVILFFLGLAAALIHRRRLQRSTWALLLISLLFLAFTLKSRRYIEYYVPFTLLFSAFAIRDAFPHLTFRDLFARFRQFATTKTALSTILFVYFLITFSTVAFRDVTQAKRDLSQGNGLTFTTYRSAMDWLKANGQPGEVVLHSDWDEFPLLFYHNTENVYIAGLDATFFYRENPDLYRTWRDITVGTFTGDLTRALRNDFDARWVFLTTDHTAMDQLMRRDPDLTLVFEGDGTKLYRVEAAPAI